MAEIFRRDADGTIFHPTTSFVVVLRKDEDPDRAERMLAAAVLTINDKVTSLYRGQQAPARTSELERGNYRRDGP